MPGFIVHAERKGLNGSFRYGHAFFLRTCLMSSASGWTLRTGSKDKETPGVQERRLSGKDIRFLYMVRPRVDGRLHRQSETCSFSRGFHVIRGADMTLFA